MTLYFEKINIFRTGLMIKLKKLSIYDLLVGLIVELRLNQ